MKLKFDYKLRQLWAEKTFDLLNIGAGSMLFGQFLSEKWFSWEATVAGLCLVVLAYISSYVLHRGGEEK